MKNIFPQSYSILFCLIWFCTSSMEANAHKGHDYPKSYRADCIMPEASLNMEINQVRAKIGINYYFRSQTMIGPAYQNMNHPHSPINVANLWLGGYDVFNNLKVASPTFITPFSNDYWAGPINPENGETHLETCNQWDKLFSVLGQNISTHKSNFQATQNTGIPYKVEDIPLDVLGWPGVGNPFFEQIHGFQIPSYVSSLAPFFDVNGDGIYNPQEGDFPQNDSKNINIPEILSTRQQMIFSIKNDVGNVHTASRGFPIGAEIRTLAFAFDVSSSMNEIIFYNTKITNQRSAILENFYGGIFADLDIPCGTFADFIGYDSTRNMAFVYEGIVPDFPQSCECQGEDFDCNFTLGAGLVMCQGFDKKQGDPHSSPVSSFTYYLNAGLGAAVPAMIDPSSSIEYYRYLSGKWRDGTPYTYGGNGYNPQSNAYTRYVYPSNPSDSSPGSWSMCTDPPPLGDRRVVMSTGHITLLPGQTNEFTFGTVAAFLSNNGCPDITPLLDHADEASDLFDSGTVSTYEANNLDTFKTKLFPNPYYRQQQGQNISLNFDKLPQNGQLILMDVHGKALAKRDINTHSSDTDNWEIKLRDVPAGLYFISISDQNKANQVLKLLIMD